MEDLKKLINQAINEMMDQLKELKIDSLIQPGKTNETLPLSGDEKYIKQQQADDTIMPVNVASKMYERKNE